MFKWLFVLPLVAFAVACGSEARAQSQFWDTNADVVGQSWDFFNPNVKPSLDELIKQSDVVVTVRIADIHDVELPDTDYSNIIYPDPSIKAYYEQQNKVVDAIPLATTYSGEVDSWIKGSGDSSILVRSSGGISAYDGTVVFFDGYFLLEPGRSYLLFLYWDTDQEIYQLGSARESFDITDGVKVLNHPYTSDLEHLEDMSVDDFVSYVKQLADNDAKTD
jgi:hypothetical protein